MTRYYKIADLTVEMDTFGRTEKQAAPYLIDGPQTPDFVVTGDPEKLREEYPEFSLDDCEYMSTGRNFYIKLLKHDGLLVHSSAVVVDGKAYIFSAPSGTGKSTHTKLWLKKFGRERAFMLNDDKPAIRLIDGVFYASGTPWSGKYDYSTNASVPLAGICMLRRGEINKIYPYEGSKVFYDILNQTIRPRSNEGRVLLTDLVSQLIEKVPIWMLECNMDPEAADVAYGAMSGTNSSR